MIKRFFLITLIFTVLVFPSSYAAKCEPGWKCQGAWRIYENEICELLVKEYCPYGCDPGGCIAPVNNCKEEWLCNGNFREFKDASCQIAKKEYCAEGCKNSACLSKKELNVSDALKDRENYLSFSQNPGFNFSHYKEAIDISLLLKNCSSGDFKGFVLKKEDIEVSSIVIIDKKKSEFSGFNCIRSKINSSSDTKSQLIACSWDYDKKFEIVTISSNNNIREKFCDGLKCPGIGDCETIETDRNYFRSTEKIQNLSETIELAPSEAIKKQDNFFSKILTFFKRMFRR